MTALISESSLALLWLNTGLQSSALGLSNYPNPEACITFRTQVRAEHRLAPSSVRRGCEEVLGFDWLIKKTTGFMGRAQYPQSRYILNSTKAPRCAVRKNTCITVRG